MDDLRNGFFLTYTDSFGKAKIIPLETPDVTMAVANCKEKLKEMPKTPKYSELRFRSVCGEERKLASFER